MKKGLLSTILLIGLVACQKESVEPTFTVKYTFINQGDNRVLNAIINTTTTFPKEGKVCYFDEAFQKVTPYDTLTKVVEGPYAYPAYTECSTYMRVVIHFKEPVSSPFNNPVSDQGTVWSRAYEIKQDNIQGVQDSEITFSWPTDTLRYQEIPWK